jgi:iron complex outermembrane receptor protein
VRLSKLEVKLAIGLCIICFVTAAQGMNFNIPPGELITALDAYSKQTGQPVIISGNMVEKAHTEGVRGELSADAALTRLLSGTGFDIKRRPSGALMIVPVQSSSVAAISIAATQAAPASSAVLETVTVTSSKIGGDVQSIPISITALSQEQLTATQTTGGPDLIKQVPNMTFTKTNFTGYSIQLRGIGTQAISVTTDPAVAVAFNDIPFIRNHFFEQEFYDVSQVEVLRGPQGTLYGRNATAGVVNLVSAKPSDQFEAMASMDIGNYQNRRLEGMLNVPIVDDRLDFRVAGEWTKRNGYTFDSTLDTSVDGRDLWSGRATLGWKPVEHLQAYLIWEHFSEDDDRLRSAKQLCKTDWGPGGSASNPVADINGQLKLIGPFEGTGASPGDFFSQGCLPTSLYSPDAFETPVAYVLPYVSGGEITGKITGADPYPGNTQSTNLRSIESPVMPTYRAKNDTLELNADYDITPSLTFTSQTGYNSDSLWSFEDYNRFDSVPGVFATPFCDPQLGCSTRLIIDDLAEEHAWQGSQEFRLASNFRGPFNFTAGANYLHYETIENYYIFSNVFTAITNPCSPVTTACIDNGFQYNDGSPPHISNGYVDPNPLSNLNNDGHNYFLSQNPYVLNSYAAFGEASYNFTDDLKFTGGLRWTDDRKHFLDIPSWLVESGYGYPIAGVVNQQWNQLTGRAVVNWSPKLNFTDQSMFYGSYSRGYKAGGANPPGAIFTSDLVINGQDVGIEPVHPLTFRPEFVDAYELGTKNTLLDGALTLNGDVFFYNYKDYQISEIVDRTAINQNFSAKVKGAELEANWEPLPGLKFNFSGGYEDTSIDNGEAAVDLMDRTAGRPGWVLVKPFLNEASNCIFPTYVAQWFISAAPSIGSDSTSYCAYAYLLHDDPLTRLTYVPNPTVTASSGGPVSIPAGYPGFDPSTAPNDGTGFAKNLGGNKLPNAPPFTVSFGAQYTLPITQDWAGTLRGDYYWQDYSWARVFNDNPYDRLRGYTNVNLTLIFTNQNGWQVMWYVKNIFNTTDITGDFLNSDDSGLTTNVFLTDPRLIGVRVTKNW